MDFYLYEYIIGIFYFLKFKSHWTKKTEGKGKEKKTYIIYYNVVLMEKKETVNYKNSYIIFFTAGYLIF